MPREFTFPDITEEQKQGIANFLYRYEGLHKVIVLYDKTIWYFHGEGYGFADWTRDIGGWINGMGHGEHTFDWNDVYIAPNEEYMRTMQYNKEYTRHD